VLIAGPTASGKSARALKTAAATGGVIVNTDSMQVYDGLSHLTARPQGADLEMAPHRLYGFVPPSERFSAGAWVARVEELIQVSGDAPLIFVGGTGLYFKALTEGFTAAPEVPAAVMTRLNAEVGALDRAGRAALIERVDPAMAARLNEPDPQRVVRALAVMEVTGRSLASWQDDTRPPLLADHETERVVLNPDRDDLGQRIARRFSAMLDEGAVEEVEALLALDLDPDLPVMKAIGVREIADWLAGTITREAAVDKSVIATRQYAKRQRTWFRKFMADWQWVDA